MRDLTSSQIDRAVEILDLLSRLSHEYTQVTDGRSMTDDYDALGEIGGIAYCGNIAEHTEPEVMRAFINSGHTPALLGAGSDSMAEACWEIFHDEVEAAVRELGLYVEDEDVA